MRIGSLVALTLSIVCLAQAVLSQPLPAADSSHAYHWRKNDSSTALLRGTKTVWQFNYESTRNTPCFHPVSTVTGQPLTWERPPDHAWHHGVWFGWTYINGVNYWEHVAGTDKPAGRTEWADVLMETADDGSARIRLALSYRPAGANKHVLSEERSIDVSPPQGDGTYWLDWTSLFTAGDERVTLDRLVPREQGAGGYAGLSVRFAKEFVDRQATNIEGPAGFGPGDRHRGRSQAMDYSGLIDGQPAGLAILDHPDNPPHPAPWYAIRGRVIGYLNAALLAEAPLVLEPGQALSLRYRVSVHPGRWDAARLRAAVARYHHASEHESD